MQCCHKKLVMETCWLLDHFALATLSIVIEDTNLVFLTGSIMISG